jgi:hypothetical protein
MKKIFILLTLIAAFSMLPNNASAAKTLSGTTTTVIGGANIKASTGVTLIAVTGGTSNSTFAVRSKHTSGDKIYDATSVNPSVVESNSTVGGTISAPTAP